MKWGKYSGARGKQNEVFHLPLAPEYLPLQLENPMPQVTVLAPGDGNKFWIVGDHLTFKVGPEQTGGKYAVALTWTPPGGGPPPHVHANEDEMFYILDGKLLFIDNQHTFTAGPGSAVYLKKGVPHAFKNIGDSPATFLVTATPAGFEAFIAAAGEKITKIPCGLAVTPEVIGKLMAVAPQFGLTMLPEHKPVGEKKFTPNTRQRWVLGQHVTVKLASAETCGNFCVADVLIQPGQGVPSHKHVAMDEYFYVTEGAFDFLIDGRTVAAPTGSFIHVPKGVMHGFTNVGNIPAKLADFHTPGGFEAFFEECGQECTDPTKPPKVEIPDMDSLRTMWTKHGMVMG